MNKKTSKFPEHLTAGRHLGRHLPRIASGEVQDEFTGEEKTDEEPPPAGPSDDWQTRRVERATRAKSEGRVEGLSRSPAVTPRNRGQSVIAVGESEDVVGMRGRLRLSRDMTSTTPVSPLPYSRTRGLWADVQRHLLQAYEYLCHVGEAKQWIEGCLGEEVPFDVVEMEERMRDGVVLAKLVRVFRGQSVVRRIYEVGCHEQLVYKILMNVITGTEAGLPTFGQHQCVLQFCAACWTSGGKSHSDLLMIGC
jgi:Ras GTPase-activating-like protein IQGAP2/3